MKKDLLRDLHTDTGLQPQRHACSKVYSNSTQLHLRICLHTQQHKRKKHLKSNWTDRTVTATYHRDSYWLPGHPTICHHSSPCPTDIKGKDSNNSFCKYTSHKSTEVYTKGHYSYPVIFFIIIYTSHRSSMLHTAFSQHV